jgi:hypothetical protein
LPKSGAGPKMALPLFFCLLGLSTFPCYDKNRQFLRFLGKFYLGITSNGINKLVKIIFLGIKIALLPKYHENHLKPNIADKAKLRVIVGRKATDPNSMG